MNVHTMQSRSFKIFIKNALRHTLIILASVYLSVALAEITFQFTIYLRGENISSDAGIRVYEHSNIAFLFWLIAFPLLAWVLAFLIKRVLSQDSNLPYWFVGIISFEFWVLRILMLLFAPAG